VLLTTAITRLVDAEAQLLSSLSRAEQKRLAESLKRLSLDVAETD
jgi:hypothetical protein